MDNIYSFQILFGMFSLTFYVVSSLTFPDKEEEKDLKGIWKKKLLYVVRINKSLPYNLKNVAYEVFA